MWRERPNSQELSDYRALNVDGMVFLLQARITRSLYLMGTSFFFDDKQLVWQRFNDRSHKSYQCDITSDDKHVDVVSSPSLRRLKRNTRLALSPRAIRSSP